jgi:hypothetical protein
VFTFSAGPAAASGTCPTVNSVTGAVSPAPAPGVTWQGCVLANANLSGSDLTGANLAGTDLTGPRGDTGRSPGRSRVPAGFRRREQIPQWVYTRVHRPREGALLCVMPSSAGPAGRPHGPDAASTFSRSCAGSPPPSAAPATRVSPARASSAESSADGPRSGGRRPIRRRSGSAPEVPRPGPTPGEGRPRVGITPAIKEH